MTENEQNINVNAPQSQPGKETVAAMLEAERIAKDPAVKGYTDLDELFRDLKELKEAGRDENAHKRMAQPI